MTDIIYFLAPFIGFACLAIGYGYSQWIPGVLGGIILFLFGVSILITPIDTFTNLQNLLVAVPCFGFGGYVMIVGSVEKIQEVL